MPERPSLTEDMILQRVGAQSVLRGRGYWQSGALSQTRRQGDLLKARCQGSADAPYRVEVNVAGGAVGPAHCSCPIGGSGYCKHVAALLLAWQHDPASFIEVEHLETALAQRSKEELIALIRQMLRIEPDLESLLTVPLPVPGSVAMVTDPALFRSQADAAFQKNGREWDILTDIAEHLRAVNSLGDDFLANGDAVSASAVYRAVLESLLENYEGYEDQEGDLAGVVAECIEGLSHCLEQMEQGHQARQPILSVLFAAYRLDIRRGGTGLAEEAPGVLIDETTPDERQVIAGWVRNELGSTVSDWARGCLGGFLLDLEEELLSDEDFLAICRESGRTGDLVDRLLQLGRVEEATTALRSLSDFSLLQLETVFAEHQQQELFEAQVKRRVYTTTDSRLKDWVKKLSLKRGDLRTALDLAEQVFRERPYLATYQEVREIATKMGEWETLRPQLLPVLEGRSPQLLLEVFLEEGKFDDALNALRTAQRGFWYGDSIRLEVAQKVEATHPEDALAIYRTVAEHLINIRGRENYASACVNLKRVRGLHIRLCDNAGWERYIAQLQERHRALRAFKEELARAGI